MTTEQVRDEYGIPNQCDPGPFPFPDAHCQRVQALHPLHKAAFAIGVWRQYANQLQPKHKSQSYRQRVVAPAEDQLRAMVAVTVIPACTCRPVVDHGAGVYTYATPRTDADRAIRARH